MSPDQVSNQAVRLLQILVLKMRSYEWNLILFDEREEESDRSQRAIREIQNARIRIRNSILPDTRGSLMEGTEGFLAGNNNQRIILVTLKQVTQVLVAVEDTLSVVSKFAASFLGTHCVDSREDALDEKMSPYPLPRRESTCQLAL